MEAFICVTGDGWNCGPVCSPKGSVAGTLARSSAFAAVAFLWTRCVPLRAYRFLRVCHEVCCFCFETLDAVFSAAFLCRRLHTNTEHVVAYWFRRLTISPAAAAASPAPPSSCVSQRDSLDQLRRRVFRCLEHEETSAAAASTAAAAVAAATLPGAVKKTGGGGGSGDSKRQEKQDEDKEEGRASRGGGGGGGKVDGGSPEGEDQGLGWLRSHLAESLSSADGRRDVVSQTLRALER